MSDDDQNDDAQTIVDEPLTRALGSRYLTYALSTIMHRALPDVRDGLKPVHRRLLYAMRVLKLNPDSAFKKSARVVGDVIGKYHPHGEQAVYDALVRLAQDFNSRYPLIDGQGNFGNLDGDNAAAQRYTECRLTDVAFALLEGLDDDAVDFRPNYDGQEHEPEVLPAAFPNLLANGANGIAVGMATSIPPHNAGELCDALLHLLKHPNAGIDTLLEHVPGPDFSNGRHPCRGKGVDPRCLRDRARRVQAARALASRGSGARALSDHCHRDALSGAEIEADRADRRADHREESAYPRRCER